MRAAARSVPVCLPAVGARGAREEHANKLALYLKQLLGIAVTHGPRSSGPVLPGRNGRASERRAGWRGVERAFGEREGRRAKRNRSNKEEEGEGGREDGEEENEIKCRDEAFRISSSGSGQKRWKRRRLHEERERGRNGPKEDPAQSGDKRVVRTVLNRSEYLYAASSFAPFLPCLCPPSSRPSTFSTVPCGIFLITRS